MIMTATALNSVTASYTVITKKLKGSGIIIRVIVNCAFCKYYSNTSFKVFLIDLISSIPKMFPFTIQIIIGNSYDVY